MKKTSVLIIGSSGHSKVIIDIFEKIGDFRIIGLIDDFRLKGEKTLGYEVIGGLKEALLILKDDPNCAVFIAIGDNWARQEVFNKIISYIPSVNFPNAIHPSTIIGKGVKLGRGVACMAGAIINSEAQIGNFSFINTNACAGH